MDFLPFYHLIQQLFVIYETTHGYIFHKIQKKNCTIKICNFIKLTPIWHTTALYFWYNEKEAFTFLPFFYLLVYLYSALAYYTVAFFLLPIISIKSYKL